MKLDIHVHIHNHSHHCNSEVLAEVKENIMSLKESFEALRVEMNDATNKLAAKIDALIEQNNRTDLTEAEEQAVLDGFQGVSNQLKALGADPTNPVPSDEPVDE